MGNLPQIDQPAILPVRLATPDHLMDHHFMGQPVLPAVMAMEILAKTIQTSYPHLAVNRFTEIRFDKFLQLDFQKKYLDAFVELRLSESGHQWQASLITRTMAPKAKITRTKVHAQLTLGKHEEPAAPWPMDVVAVPEGICRRVHPDKIYADLVPFGPAFRNISSPAHISLDGALVRIETPDSTDDDVPFCLGSPYTLDAAMHGACVWAQHFKGIVAFPVAMEDREILAPTMPGRTYYGRVRPRSVTGDVLIFDISLLDDQGDLCEMVKGVHMRDVSGGRLKPPTWIVPENDKDPLAEIKKGCHKLTVVELDAVAPFAFRALTPLEGQRYQKMENRRQKSYLAARLALKRLYRRCNQSHCAVPADRIETVQKNSPLPHCTLMDATSESDMHLTASHDRRLAVAAIDANPVGIDVEPIGDKALDAGRIFMAQAEHRLVEQSRFGRAEAAVRVWSVKEAATKVLGLSMADAWQRVQVTRIGDYDSDFQVDGTDWTARHGMIDEHLVTLVVMPKRVVIL